MKSASSLDQKLNELKAQILYRLEQYDECYETYKSIIKNSSDDYEDEREANLSAVLANLYMEKTVSFWLFVEYCLLNYFYHMFEICICRKKNCQN